MALTHIWQTTLFIAGMGLMEGHSLSEGLEEFRDKFWEFYKASTPVRVWPADQCTSTNIILHSWHCKFYFVLIQRWDFNFAAFSYVCASVLFACKTQNTKRESWMSLTPEFCSNVKSAHKRLYFRLTSVQLFAAPGEEDWNKTSQLGVSKLPNYTVRFDFHFLSLDL